MEFNTTNDEPFEIIPWQPMAKGIWFILFLITAILGIIGNGIVAWIVLAHRSMKTNTNVYIGNMAVGNILIAMFSLPFVFPYHTLAMKPVASTLLCMFQEYSISMGVCVSIFSLTLLSIERFYTITSPENTLSSIKSWPTLKIWLISFIVSVPNWIFVSLQQTPIHSSSVLFMCTPLWPESLGGELSREIYSNILSILTYFIPIIINVFKLVRLAVKLWNSKSIDLTVVDRALHKRWLWIMVGLVLVFGITWFPYRTSSLLVDDTILSVLVKIENLFTGFYLLAMSSILYCPIIFCCLDARFNKKLRKVVRCCPCVDYESKSLNYALDGTAQHSINMAERYQAISDV